MKKALILFIAISISVLQANAQKVTVDSEGNIYLLGLVQDSITFSDSTTIVTNNEPFESPKTYLVKLDSSGRVLWYKLFDQNDESFDIKADHSNNLLIATGLMGTVQLDSTTALSGTFQFLIAKFDPNGNLVWYNLSSKNYSNYYLSFSVDSLNNIYTAGIFSGTFHCNGEDTIFSNYPVYRTFLAKFDSGGNNIWLRKIDGYPNEVLDIDGDNSGNSVIVGEFKNSMYYQGDSLVAAGEFDGFWAKIDPNGDLIKMKRINSSGFDFIYDVGVGSNGNFSYTGSYYDDTLFIDNFPITINTSSSPGNFVASVKNQNTEAWLVNFNGANASKYHGVEMDDSNNTYLYTLWEEYFYNSSLNTFVGSDISNSNYLIKMDSAGNPLCFVKINSGQISDVAILEDGSIYVVGRFENTLTLNGTTYTQNDNAIFIASFDLNCNTTWTSLIANPITGIHEVSNTGNGISIFPNPATHTTTVSLSDYPVKSGKIILFNIEGKTMMELDFSDREQIELDIEKLFPGIYIIQVITNDQQQLNYRIVKI